MTRSLSIALLLSVVAGCGVGPSDETNQAFLPPRCPPGQTFIVDNFEIASSSGDPWGHVAGDVVSYYMGTNSNGDYFLIFGWDPVAAQVVWYMKNATVADINKLESYPQSSRYCGGICPPGLGGCTNNPGSGTAKGTPDPQLRPGACVPAEIADDARAEYLHGPIGGWDSLDYCAAYGAGGCVPQSCSTLHLGCGYQNDNCGQRVWCGVCPVPPPPDKCECGGTWPSHCKKCI